jgi:ferric-dicitrate binding protein FerR (iron transport regulator)
MAASKRAAKARGAAEDAWTNPYVQRLVQDPDVRDDVRVAFENLRSAYGRVSNGKAPARALMEDKKLHKDLQRAGAAVRSASSSLRQGPKKPKRRRLGRMLLLGIVGAGLAIALSEDLRNKVLDALFGAEEEFDYTSTTTPPPAPSATPTGAASNN